MKQRNFVLTIVAAVVMAGLVPAVAMAGNNIVVTLRGPGELIADADSPLPGQLCYPGELVNTKTNRVIGTGIDCLANDTAEDGVISLDRTTFFFFPQGTLVAVGRTTVSPIKEGSPGFTHVVGDITPGNNILHDLGTRRFRHKTGSVRLSGAVDLGGLQGGPPFPDGIVFNCIFVIDLD